MPKNRVAFITFPKCGSQWVRDVLSDRDIVKLSGMVADPPQDLELQENWKYREGPAFVGPIYNASMSMWLNCSQDGDRAVVVLRDPRDQIVSWVFSLCYSHRPTRSTRIFRDMLGSLDDRGKLALMCEHWRIFHGSFLSFASRQTDTIPNCLVTSYEKLVADERDGFSEILDFLEWEVPQAVLDRVLARYSFFSRSGRQPGHQDARSHLRKAQPGDWMNYFDRSLGRFFEMQYEGLLQVLGYETNSAWYETLPEHPRLSFAL